MRRRSGNSILDWASFFRERKEAESEQKREAARREKYQTLAKLEGLPTGLEPDDIKKILVAKYGRKPTEPKQSKISDPLATITKLAALGPEYYGGEENKQAVISKALGSLLKEKYDYEPTGEIIPTQPEAQKTGLSKYVRPFMKGVGQGLLSRSPVVINESPITKALGKAKEKETAGNVEMEAPNGQRFTVDQSEVEDAKKHGWKITGKSTGRKGMTPETQALLGTSKVGEPGGRTNVTQLPLFMGVSTGPRPGSLAATGQRPDLGRRPYGGRTTGVFAEGGPIGYINPLFSKGGAIGPIPSAMEKGGAIGPSPVDELVFYKSTYPELDEIWNSGNINIKFQAVDMLKGGRTVKEIKKALLQ